MTKDRPKATTRMCFEIGHCHLTAGEERSDPSKQASRNEYAAAELDDACDQTFRIMNLAVSTKHCEKLLSTVTGIQQAGDNPQNRVALTSMVREKRSHTSKA